MQHMANPWKAAIDDAVDKKLRPADPHAVHPRRTIVKDDGSEAEAPVEPLLVSTKITLDSHNRLELVSFTVCHISYPSLESRLDQCTTLCQLLLTGGSGH